MKLKKWRFQLALLFVLSIIHIISTQSLWVEVYYSKGLYPIIARTINSISSLFPFALGELIIVLFFITIFMNILWWVLKKNRNRSMIYIGRLKRRLSMQILLSFVLVFAISFQLVWGLNYSRMPLGSSLGMELKPRAVNEVHELLNWHIEKANKLRKTLEEEDFRKSYNVWTGYENLPDSLKYLSQVESYGKNLMSSAFFSYAGIAGIYNPFFAEANVNALQVDFMLPVVEAHELAHLQGIAREDEANYTAVMVCMSHEEPLVQYSGHMLALIHLSNALYNSDNELWKSSKLKISDLVQKDLNRNSEFWDAYEGWFEEASSDLNDTYLKINGQSEGVKSYGRMIDLLLASFEEYSIEY